MIIWKLFSDKALLGTVIMMKYEAVREKEVLHRDKLKKEKDKK